MKRRAMEIDRTCSFRDVNNNTNEPDSMHLAEGPFLARDVSSMAQRVVPVGRMQILRDVGLRNAYKEQWDYHQISGPRLLNRYVQDGSVDMSMDTTSPSEAISRSYGRRLYPTRIRKQLCLSPCPVRPCRNCYSSGRAAVISHNHLETRTSERISCSDPRLTARFAVLVDNRTRCRRGRASNPRVGNVSMIWTRNGAAAERYHQYPDACAGS